MGFFFAFLASLNESIGKTIDKLNFTKNHVTYRQSLLITFFGMSLFLLGFILTTREHLPDFTLISIGLMGLIVLFSFGGNVFDEMSLKADDLSLREPMVDFEPILAGLVAYALFPHERKPIILLAFLASALVVHWGTHRRRLGKVQKKGMGYLLLAAILYAVLPSIYKEALKYYSPAYISFIRSAVILVLLAIFLPVRRISKLSTAKVKYSMTSALVYSIEAVVALYAIKQLGVVLTMLILMLGPALRYWSSAFILKERVRKGEMAASFVLVLIVLVGAFS